MGEYRKKKDDELSYYTTLSSLLNLTYSPSARAFKASGNDYRWKRATNEAEQLIRLIVSDICQQSKDTSLSKHDQCTERRSMGLVNREIATWSQESLTLRVRANSADILDRLIVTCALNLYLNSLGQW